MNKCITLLKINKALDIIGNLKKRSLCARKKVNKMSYTNKPIILEEILGK